MIDQQKPVWQVRDEASDYACAWIESAALVLAHDRAACRAWRESRGEESIGAMIHRLEDQEFSAVMAMPFARFVDEVDAETGFILDELVNGKEAA